MKSNSAVCVFKLDPDVFLSPKLIPAIPLSDSDGEKSATSAQTEVIHISHAVLALGGTIECFRDRDCFPPDRYLVRLQQCKGNEHFRR